MNWKVDWNHAFVPSVSPLEIILRGTIMYLVLFCMLRIFKRQTGSMSISDLLLIVLIADAAQNGMASDYKSVTDGLLLVATLVFWNYVLDWMAFRYKSFGKWFFPPPLCLIENGRMNLKSMRHELISRGELMSVLREHGIERVEDVKRAFMEGDGQISVIKKQAGDDEPTARGRRGV